MLQDLNELEELFSTEGIQKAKNTEYELYRPDLAKSVNSEAYESVLRFILNIRDKNKSMVSKWGAYLKNPSTNESKMVDCPSTLGYNQPSILRDTYHILANHNNQAIKNLASNFSRKKNIFSLVQVIEDVNDPTVKGKIKVFRYGSKLEDKLITQIKDAENPKSTIPTSHPFDLFSGSVFRFRLTKVAGFNNFDSSSFVDIKKNFSWEGKEFHKTRDDYEVIRDLLLEHSPDLSKYEFKPWDDEITNFVLGCIEEIIPDKSIIETIYKKHNISLSRLKNVTSSTSVMVDSVLSPSPKKSAKKEVEDVLTKVNDRASTSTNVVDVEDDEAFFGDLDL